MSGSTEPIIVQQHKQAMRTQDALTDLQQHLACYRALEALVLCEKRGSEEETLGQLKRGDFAMLLLTINMGVERLCEKALAAASGNSL